MHIDGHEVRGFKQDSATYHGVYYSQGWMARGITATFKSPEAAALAHDALALDKGGKHNFLTRMNGAVVLVAAQPKKEPKPKHGPKITDQDHLHVERVVGYMEKDPGAKVKFTELYDAYTELCQEVLECEPLSRSKLSHILTTLGYPTVTGAANTRYKVGLDIE